MSTTSFLFVSNFYYHSANGRKVLLNFLIFFQRKFSSTGSCTLICIYITYTMLPIRLREAIVGGLLLSGTHVTLLVFLNGVKSNTMVNILYLMQIKIKD